MFSFWLNISILCFFLVLVNTQEIEEGTYTIRLKSGTSGLAIQDGSMYDGARAIITSTASEMATFDITSAGSGLYYIFAKHSGKVLDEDMKDHYIQQWKSVSGNGHQMWKFIRITKDLYVMQGFESKRYLVAYNTERVETALIYGDLSLASSHFRWMLEYVPKDYCLTLISMSIGSVGDLDEQNEEVELEITSNKTTVPNQINCGLFLFDFKKNTKDKNLQITVPCKEDEYVQVRILERDNCNDDTFLLPIQCTPTSGNEMKEIIIKPDSTATSYSSCISYSHQVQACLNFGVKLGVVSKANLTGNACYAYQ